MSFRFASRRDLKSNSAGFPPAPTAHNVGRSLSTVVCGRTRTCNLRALCPVELYTDGIRGGTRTRSLPALYPVELYTDKNQCAGLSPPVALPSRETRADSPCNDLSKRLTRLSGRRSRRVVSNDEHLHGGTVADSASLRSSMQWTKPEHNFPILPTDCVPSLQISLRRKPSAQRVLCTDRALVTVYRTNGERQSISGWTLLDPQLGA